MMRFIFIEEASRTFSSDGEDRYDLGEGPGMGFLRSARKIDDNTAVIFTDQTPSGLNRATIANCSNFISFTLVDSKDVWAAGCAEGLEAYQRKELVALGPREIIVRLKRYSKKPLKIQVDEIAFPAALSKKQAREQSRGVLDSIPFVKHATEKVEDAQDEEEKLRNAVGGLHPRVKKVFCRIAERPWELIEDRFEALNLDRDSENDARKKLKACGLIRRAGTIGAKNLLFELTERGRKVAERWV